MPTVMADQPALSPPPPGGFRAGERRPAPSIKQEPKTGSGAQGGDVDAAGLGLGFGLVAGGGSEGPQEAVVGGASVHLGVDQLVLKRQPRLHRREVVLDLDLKMVDRAGELGLRRETGLELVP